MGEAAPAINVNMITNRKVWVLNRHHQDYVELFRGEEIRVPANDKKEILMPWLAAERFLGQPKAAAVKLPNGTFDNPPKALWIVELTDEERAKLEGKTTKQLETEVKSLEIKAKKENTRLNKKNANAVNVGDDEL